MYIFPLYRRYPNTIWGGDRYQQYEWERGENKKETEKNNSTMHSKVM